MAEALNVSESFASNFDVNSFIRKTLSNFDLRPGPLAAEQHVTLAPPYSCQPCAYCGSNNKDDITTPLAPASSVAKNLYCQSCRELFLRNTKTDIKCMIRAAVDNDSKTRKYDNSSRKILES